MCSSQHRVCSIKMRGLLADDSTFDYLSSALSFSAVVGLFAVVVLAFAFARACISVSDGIMTAPAS